MVLHHIINITSSIATLLSIGILVSATIDSYLLIKLGSWTIARHFSQYFASVIASSNIMVEYVSPLTVSVSLVNTLSLVFLSFKKIFI